MSFGGGDYTSSLSPEPRQILPGVEKAKIDLREKLRRAASRQMSIVAPMGLLELEAPIMRPALKGTL